MERVDLGDGEQVSTWMVDITEYLMVPWIEKRYETATPLYQRH